MTNDYVFYAIVALFAIVVGRKAWAWKRASDQARVRMKDPLIFRDQQPHAWPVGEWRPSAAEIARRTDSEPPPDPLNGSHIHIPSLMGSSAYKGPKGFAAQQGDRRAHVHELKRRLR